MEDRLPSSMAFWKTCKFIFSEKKKPKNKKGSSESFGNWVDSPAGNWKEVNESPASHFLFFLLVPDLLIFLFMIIMHVTQWVLSCCLQDEVELSYVVYLIINI